MAEATFNDFVKDIAAGSAEARLALAQKLKQANLWTGKVTDKLNTNYYNALVKLEAAYKQQAAIDKITGTKTPIGRYDVLTNLIAEGGGTGTLKTTANRYYTSASQTAKLLDTVAQDLLGRKLTKAEQAKYTKLINAEQKRQPSYTTTADGSVTTRGGIDEEQIAAEQISATGEAKTKRANDAYTVMMEELGGLR